MYKMAMQAKAKPTIMPFVFAAFVNIPHRNKAHIGPPNRPLTVFEKSTMSTWIIVLSTARTTTSTPKPAVIFFERQTISVFLSTNPYAFAKISTKKLVAAAFNPPLVTDNVQPRIAPKMI